MRKSVVLLPDADESVARQQTLSPFLGVTTLINLLVPTMTSTIFRAFLSTAFLLLLMACGAPAPEVDVAVEATSHPSSTVGTEPTLEVETDLPVTQEANVAHTETIAPEQRPEPQLKEVPSVPKSPVPPAPANGTEQNDTQAKEPVKTPAPPTPPAATNGNTAPPTPPAPAPAPPTPAPEETLPAKPNHLNFNALLQKHVNNAGNVNYAAFKQDEAKLDAYLAELQKSTPQKEWSRAESLAYWINAYNAGTIKLILKNWPVKSIMDLHSGKPWDVKWIKLGSSTYSLNQIEHDIIRPRYKDARIHFAVNCAAASCPPLPNKAFTGSNLNSLLTSRTRAFVRNSAYNTISDTEVKVSKIFDWYGDDFGDLRAYLNKYTATAIPAAQEIGFREYDWSLNKQ